LSDKTGILVLVAAAIIGAALVGASLVIKSSVDRTTAELAGLRTALTEATGGGRAEPARAPARPDRPDPSRRYSVETDGAPVRGPESAPVSIVEFSDFQCPFCRRVTPTMSQLRADYGDKVRIVFKNLPLSIHPKAPAAHAAAEAAHRQGKFWEMHDRIFANQGQLEPEVFERYAKEIGLDMKQYRADVASSEVKERIAKDVAEARSLGVTGTPGFFINGRFVSGAQPYGTFKRLVDEELGKG
jgi:protein-disulfide isomerase